MNRGFREDEPGRARHDGGGDDWLGDGARAVGDCQGSGLGHRSARLHHGD